MSGDVKPVKSNGWSLIRAFAMGKTTMENIIVEIRAGEGGEDAKLLVEEQTKLYLKYFQRRCL